MNMFHIQALPAGWMNAKPTYVFAMLYSIFTSDIENFSGDFYSDRAHIQALDVSAKAFAHMILDSLLRDLHYRRPPQKLWNRLRFMNLILVRWFFPSSHKSHRTCAPLEIVLATVVSAKSLIWLRTRHWTVQAQRVLRFLPPLARAALEWGGLPHSPSRAAALAYVIRMQKNFIDGCPDLFGLYQWWTEDTRYTGIGHLQRPSLPSQGGLSKRLMEHLFATVRPTSPEGGKLRYRLARKVSPESSFFMIVAVGAESCIRAMETFDIRAHGPRSNGRQKKTLSPTVMCYVRKRPPKPLRANLGQSDPSRTVNIFNRYCREHTLQISVREGLEQPHFCPWNFSFKDAYRLFQQRLHAESGFRGPLNIFEDRFRPLFMLFLATSKCTFAWKEAESFDRDAALRCALCLRKLPKSHQRTAARRVLDPWLTARGYWTSKYIQVVVPHICFTNLVHAHIAELSRIASHGRTLAAKWMTSRFKVVVTREALFSDRWNHSQLAKNMRFPTEPPSVPEVASANMYCIDQNWRVTERVSFASQVGMCLGQVDEAFGASSTATIQSIPHKIPVRLHAHWQHVRDTQATYESYTAAFQNHGIPDPALIPDDKNKKFAWAMPKPVYSRLVASFALITTSWCLTTLTAESANGWLLSLLCQVLGQSLASKLGLRAASWLLPLCYITIKGKCWFGGVRACRKLRHSCVRKIISYASWPRRRLWRSLHRGWETLLKHFGDTSDVWSLKDAAHQLQLMSSLPANPWPSHPRCCRCHRDMHAFEGIVGDAGQFYEVVDASQAIQEATELLHIFTCSSPQRYITVKHPCRKRQAWFSSVVNRFARRSVTWSLEELYRAFVASMLVCLASVGDKVFTLQSLPIGGLMSQVAASVVLGGQERRWKQNDALQRNEGYRFHLGWRQAVVHLRYVDDICLVSRVYCAHCLTYAVKSVYTVPFDVSSDDDRKLVWLDMKIFLASAELGLNTKHLYPSPPWYANISYVRNVLLGRFRRWVEIGPVQVEWHRALLSVLHELKQGGWKYKPVLSVLRSIYKDDYKQYATFGIFAWKFMRYTTCL